MSTKASNLSPRERGTPRHLEPRDETTPSLIRRLVDDVSTLFAQELALLKAETTEAIGELRAATVGMATGGAVIFLGAFFLLLAAVYGLSGVVDPWLAALLVGAVVTVLGLILLATGRRKLEPGAVAPRRTAEALRRDTQVLKGVAHHERE